jgi:tetratricopeptide (TPR) repeat protein
MQPGAGNPYNNRGLVYYRMKRYADSVVAYTASIAADPEVASSYYMRGLARRALGEQAAADADIAEGLRREPGVAERYAGYGIAYP